MPGRPSQPARRWHDAAAALTELQSQYTDWLLALPTNLQDSSLADAVLSSGARRHYSRILSAYTAASRLPGAPEADKSDRDRKVLGWLVMEAKGSAKFIARPPASGRGAPHCALVAATPGNCTASCSPT